MRILQISDFIDETRIKDLQASNKTDALNEMIELISSSPNINDSNAFKKAIFKRESLMSTGIGLGIAIPHAKIPECKDFVIAIGRLKNSIEYESLDNKPVNLIFMIGASDQQDKEYIRLLSRLVLRLKDNQVQKELIRAKDQSEIYSIITSAK
ncbi:PTS sugar transporter subunit IIA [bacterium]|nr:PTS sugar transporter subunit IIA [bacterium]